MSGAVRLTDAPPGVPFSALIEGAAVNSGELVITLPPEWLQGRTAYGGLTAALCLSAALRTADDPLPPLRSAQFAFVGPASGDLSARPQLLRRGKSTAFVRVDMQGEAGLAAVATFAFGAPRASRLDHLDVPAPSGSRDPSAFPLFFTQPGRPSFTDNFEGRLVSGARPVSPGEDPTMLVWLRHRDPHVSDDLVSIIALADALPAPAMVLYSDWAPLSTMTWSLDMLTDTPRSADGWWLLKSVADQASGGYSTQAMTLWGRDGQPVLAARQTVAVFN